MVSFKSVLIEIKISKSYYKATLSMYDNSLIFYLYLYIDTYLAKYT